MHVIDCDVCINPVELTDGTEFAQMALSAVYRTPGQRFGAAHIVDVLRGTKTDKITTAGHHLLPTFGARPCDHKNWSGARCCVSLSALAF